MGVKSDWNLGDQFTHVDANAVAALLNAVESGLAGKAEAAHTHSASDITSGTLGIARIPTGTSGSTVCVGNDSRLSNTRTPTDNTVSTAKIQDGAVTGDKISDGAVTEGKIADGAVTGDKIGDGEVAVAKLGSDVTPAMQALIHATAPTSQSSASASTHTAAVASARHRYYVTAQAAAATIAAPTGSPSAGWQLVFRIKDNGTTRTLSWNSVFRAIGVTLPTATTANKTVYVACEWNATDSKWDVLAVGQEK